MKLNKFSIFHRFMKSFFNHQDFFYLFVLNKISNKLKFYLKFVSINLDFLNVKNDLTLPLIKSVKYFTIF